ncbi:MAG TPA: TRIC cation channel family protein [Gemmatimonadaceae bacterium]|nr:TRIC cation channel family protein [Gemmatimonadaceae bacterium]
MTLVRLLDLMGIGVFAVSGALAAGRKRLDLLGVFVLASVTAIGGGTVRDLLLDRPIVWLTDVAYLAVIVFSVMVTFLYVQWRRPPLASLLVADALGLALFSVGGAQIAEHANLPAVSVVLLGTVTGVGGGVIRDVLSAEIPFVLRRGNLYASTVIFGVAVYLLLESVGVATQLASLTGMALIAAIRLAAIRWELMLPVFEVDE